MKLTLFLLTAVLMTVSSYADETQIRLLNPDGTPAMNVKAIGIMVPPARIDAAAEGLNLLSPGETATPSTILFPAMLLTADNDVVKFNATPEAIVASNDNGFAFIPKEAYRKEVTLRPWAKLKLNVATVPEALRDRYRIVLNWTNDFAGPVARKLHSAAASSPNDPFLVAAGVDDAFNQASPVPPIDWRIDPCACWMKVVEITDQTINVPPGEATIMLVATDVQEHWKQGFPDRPNPMQILALLKTKSGAEAEFRLPEFGSIKGRYASDSEQLDWSNTDGQDIHIFIAPESTVNVVPPTIVTFEIEQLLKFDASPEGFATRQQTIGGSGMMVGRNGEFTADMVPVGKYLLHRLTQMHTSHREPSTRAFIARRLVPEDHKPIDGVESLWMLPVTANETTDVGTLIEAAIPLADFTAEQTRIGLSRPTPVSQNPFAGGALPPGTELHYLEKIIATPDGKTFKRLVPARAQGPSDIPKNDPQFLPAPAAMRGAAHGHGPYQQPTTSNGELRDPVFSPDVPEKSDADEATAMIQRRLQTAGKDADQAELKKLLQEHLENEFDDSQTTRRTEIERLQSLLSKSTEWLDQRQQRRTDIVNKRIEELLKKQKASAAE